jgi:hypothetical protein
VGEGLMTAEMGKCRWLKPRLVVSIEYLEWTAANHLRLARFVGCPLASDKQITRFANPCWELSPRSAGNSGTFLAQQVLRRISGIFAEAR